MAVLNQVITDQYALYHGDSCETLPKIPDNSIHLTVYSPPFAADGGGCLYHYSSSERDLSNCRSYEEFFEHYEFIVKDLLRVLMPGRFAAVHCMDIQKSAAISGYIDFPGEIIRLHERNGWRYWCRHFVWKEPLGVRNRTMLKGLAHRTICEDAADCTCAGADQILMFRKPGKNAIPVTYPNGFQEYAGERSIPRELLPYKNWQGDQKQNRYSHWIWRQYASAIWDDIEHYLDDNGLVCEHPSNRIKILPFKEAKDEEDERHMHPLQLDVIKRVVALRSNPGEVVLTPFMGVGSEAVGALLYGRRAIGIELKDTYFRQAVRNVENVFTPSEQTNFCDLDQWHEVSAAIME